MKRKSIILIVLSALFLFSACKKELPPPASIGPAGLPGNSVPTTPPPSQ